METLADRDRRREYRLAVARRDVPEMLAWAGALTLLFGLVNYFALPDAPASAWGVNVVFGPLFLALSWLARRPSVADAVVPWVWAVSSTLLVGLLINAFRLDPSPANLAYVVAAMTALGQLTNAWWPFVLSSAGMLVMAGLAIAATSTVAFGDAFLVCVASLLISALFLRLRMKTLAALADAQAVVERDATSDPLTGVLNRTGIDRELPGLFASARRTGEQVLVWFVDVRGLKAANDRFGHEFGDVVIVAVAHALRASVRANDLVARWGGDEFVVLGLGHQGSAAELNDRVDAILRDDSSVADTWRCSVTVGFASGDPDMPVQSIITEADGDMYRRRSSA